MRQTALSDREVVREAGPKGRRDRGSRTAHEADERASKADSDPGISNAPEGERGGSTGTPRSGGAELNADEGFGGTNESGESFRKFKVGMVTTVEPGIYIRKNDRIDPKYWNIGIRIEDDVLVTKDGNHILSEAAIKNVDDIELLMSHR